MLKNGETLVSSNFFCNGDKVKGKNSKLMKKMILDDIFFNVKQRWDTFIYFFAKSRDTLHLFHCKGVTVTVFCLQNHIYYKVFLRKTISIGMVLFEKNCNSTLFQIHFSARKEFVGSCSIIIHFPSSKHLFLEQYLCFEYFIFFYLIAFHLGSGVIIPYR